MKSHQLVRCALFAALTAAGAFLRIPVGPLLYTMQLLFTMLSGLLLGAKCGALSQVLYVALGLAGLPVFGGGGGVTYLLQPTCGFVLALPLCAWLVGRLGSRRRAVPACLAGLAAVYAVGLLYLAVLLRFSAVDRFFRAAHILPAALPSRRRTEDPGLRHAVPPPAGVAVP